MYLIVLFAIFIALLILLPARKIVNRLGYRSWWLLILLIPFGPIVGLWLLAYAKWPNHDNSLNLC